MAELQRRHGTDQGQSSHDFSIVTDGNPCVCFYRVCVWAAGSHADILKQPRLPYRHSWARHGRCHTLWNTHKCILFSCDSTHLLTTVRSPSLPPCCLSREVEFIQKEDAERRRLEEAEKAHLAEIQGLQIRVNQQLRPSIVTTCQWAWFIKHLHPLYTHILILQAFLTIPTEVVRFINVILTVDYSGDPIGICIYMHFFCVKYTCI